MALLDYFEELPLYLKSMEGFQQGSPRILFQYRVSQSANAKCFLSRDGKDYSEIVSLWIYIFVFMKEKTLFFFIQLQTLTTNFSYRGYYSRKYEHDFYARKTYLNHVQHKNEEVRKKLAEYQR